MCAICLVETQHEDPYEFFVDHDHETGENRGLLCPTCNALIGMAHDDIVVLRAAARYLEVRRSLKSAA